MTTQTRGRLIRSLVGEMRLFIAGVILFNQGIARKLGLNFTDQQILNLIDLLGRATPGRLAELSGLTTGGVTVALDRLEEVGYVKREKNPTDRRSLIIRVVPAKRRKIMTPYKSINAHMGRVLSSYTEKELGLIVDFFIRTNASRVSARKKQELLDFVR